jgi:septal ring factor EnvC (AmiA/AmiB activator)
VGHSRAASVIALRTALRGKLSTFRQQHSRLTEAFETTSRGLQEAAQSVAARQQELARQAEEFRARQQNLESAAKQVSNDKLFELETELTSLREALSKVNAQLSASETQRLLAEQQIANHDAELEQVHMEHASAADAALCVELAALQEQCEALVAERDDAFIRAQDATHAFLEYKQEADQQRAELSAELRALRRVLEMQMNQWGPGTETPSRATQVPGGGTRKNASTSPPARPKKPTAPVGNPIVGSVMAQFEQLQQQRLNRDTFPK